MDLRLYIIVIVSLALALATCLIIMMQVRYEITFDKGYPTSGRIYQIDEREFPDSKYEPYITRPLAEVVSGTTPLIKNIAVRETNIIEYSTYPVTRGAMSAILAKSFMASEQFPYVFGFEFVSGSCSTFNIPGKALLPESIAINLFGTGTAVGQLLTLSSDQGERDVEIIAVYKDIPDNSSIPNAIITSLADTDISNWEVQQYCGYVLVDSPENAGEVEEYMWKAMSAVYSLSYSDVKELLQLNELHQRYFNPDNSDNTKGNINALITLISVAVLVLLIAIINFINFSVSSVPNHIKSINIKKIYGCSKTILQIEQYREAMVVSVLSAGLSLLLVYIVSKSPIAAIIDADISIHANQLLICFLFIIAILAGILAAVIPAHYSTSVRPALVIQGRFALTGKGQIFRKICIVFQYSISMILIIVSASVSTQYRFMTNYDTGYEAGQILTTRFTSTMLKQQDAITDRLKQNTDIIDVAYSSQSLISDMSMWGILYQGNMIVPYFFPVSPNFLSTMGITMIDGRDFSVEDKAGSGRYIFNQTAQREFSVKVGDNIQNHNRHNNATVIGIAKDFNFRPLHYPIEPFAFYVSGEWIWGLPYAYIKVNGSNVAQTMDYIKHTLLEYDREANSTFELEFLDESLGNLYQKEKNMSMMISVFSLLAVLISIIGTIGVIYIEMQFRKKEISIRRVFGATIADILSMFNKRYCFIIAISFIISSPIAYYVIAVWQNNFVYKAHIPIWIYLSALASVLLLATIVVSIQTYLAIKQNDYQK